MNLCTNAVHAVEPNGGTVTITADMAKQTELPAELDSSAAPGWLRISIADTGAGIPEDIRDMIFDPFFTTKEVGRGTGMGLAAVHGIVSKLGGVIHVSSDVGSGTQFDVFLPTTVDPVTTSASDPQKSVQGKANILFIDDEEGLVNLAKIQLERLGYTVDAFSNPVEAIASAAADPGRYDVLITDFSMPRMTGLNAASKFTELNPGLPVLLMTGLDPDISDDEMAAAGIRRTLIKPYSLADLSRAISESLG
jgi:CheY-like chemotaxis protein